MIDRLRRPPAVPDALAAAGLCLTLAGLAIAADALARTALPAHLSGLDRIVLGLWRFELVSTLTLTVGVGLLALGLGRRALLGGWREPAARVGAGIAIGAVVLAAAVVLASTVAAIAGHVGAVQIGGDSRLFIWLRQLATAVGFAGVWLLVATRLSAIRAVEVEREAEDEPELGPQPIPEPIPVRVDAIAPARPAPVAATPAAVAVPTVAETSEPAPETGSPSARARRIYAERLSFSPRAGVAKTVVDEVVRLEREGKAQEADALVQQLHAM